MRIAKYADLCGRLVRLEKLIDIVYPRWRLGVSISVWCRPKHPYRSLAERARLSEAVRKALNKTHPDEAR
jgi:hypothetical protein